MQSKEFDASAVVETTTTDDYADTLEGNLQYLVDISLAYQAEIDRPGASSFKRDLYRKKLVKNNNKMYKMLVRTPNAYNPLMKYIRAAEAEDTSDAIPRSGYSQIVGEDDTFDQLPEYTITTAGGDK